MTINRYFEIKNLIKEYEDNLARNFEIEREAEKILIEYGIDLVSRPIEQLKELQGSE